MTTVTTAPLVDGDGQAGSDDAVAYALDRAVGALGRQQDPAGWWKGELETNVTMEAEDLLLRQFLGIRSEDQTQQTAKWVRSRQRDDGTWATFYGGPSDLSTTIEAYAWPATRSTPRTCNGPLGSSGSPVGWRPVGSSPASGWPCSVCGRGTTSRSCRPS